MKELKYIVKRTFQYGDTTYQPGDVFEPQGARNDGAIIRTYTRVEMVEKPARRGKKQEEPEEAQHA